MRDVFAGNLDGGDMQAANQKTDNAVRIRVLLDEVKKLEPA